MLPLLGLPLGALIGFVLSRRLRRPQSAAQAASAARTVGGALGRRRGLAAPELQRACFSEMIRHVRTGPDGVTRLPVQFVLQLHPDDLATVEDARGWFTDGLVEALQGEAAEQAWQVEGTIEVRYEGDAGRRPGVPGALAVDPTPAAPAEAPRPVRRPPSPAASAPATPVASSDRSDGLVVVGPGGERAELTGRSVTVGRGNDCDLVIDDNRVSRAHARFAPGRGGWTVADLGSSNGTTCNGRLLTPNVPQAVQAGDAIGLGPVALTVEVAP